MVLATYHATVLAVEHNIVALIDTFQAAAGLGIRFHWTFINCNGKSGGSHAALLPGFPVRLSWEPFCIHADFATLLVYLAVKDSMYA